MCGPSDESEDCVALEEVTFGGGEGGDLSEGVTGKVISLLDFLISEEDGGEGELSEGCSD